MDMKTGMKRIGLLTTHSVMNYGGLLQAYALYHTIGELGYACDIINYVPDMQNATRNPIQFVLKRKNALGKAALVLKHHTEYRERIRRIDCFRKEYLAPAPRKPIDYAGLQTAVEGYDALCCGSDQIWNLSLGDMESGAYMLNFPHTVPSISYAASFGDGLVRKRHETEEALENIKAFSRISVREEEGREFLTAYGINAEVCIDPTLLVSVEKWKQIAGPRLLDFPYIFVYGFETAFQRYDDLIDAVHLISERTGYQVVNALMVPELSHEDFINRFACGPLEFLSLIRYAEHVCTNSFHACIFSHLFDTPFSVVESDGLGVDARKASLLELLGQGNRILRKDKIVDWNQLTARGSNGAAHSMLREQQDRSLRFLSNALHGVSQ